MDFVPLNHHLPHNHHQQHDHNPSSYQVWNNFFLKAGIPGNVANEYAITFSQHRIRIDMLKEITKEILLDMGIKAMGDIIAILRHAKNICTQDELKTGIFSLPKTTNPTASTNISSPSSNHHNVISPRQTMVNHSARKASISTSKPILFNASATSLVASNKVQSQVSLNSGALIASSNNLASQHDFSTNEVGNKRLSLSTNPTTKRLRPGSNSGPQNNTVLNEKTLTVHYPPTSAIERAQQRLGLTTNSTQSSSLSTRSPTHKPIKSRLGQSPQDTSGHSRVGLVSSSSSMSSRNSNHNKTWSGVVKSGNVHSKPNQRASSRSPNSTSTNRRGPSWKGRQHKEKPNERQEPRRLKSAVFSRLGGSAR